MVRYRYPSNYSVSPRHLQDVFKTCIQEVFARRLQDVLEDEKLLRRRCVEDVFDTS